jgi:hypothetical protein
VLAPVIVSVEVTEEIRLGGGRVTEGVVRVRDTVRRPPKPNSAFVRELLAHLEKQRFECAPRYLGADELGREVFSYLPGEVPADLDANFSDEVLAAAARLIRRYHDAMVGSALAGEQETVCHNDLSPCNFVFRDGAPVGIIDFDAAEPGTRLQDIGYAIFLWLNLGTDGPSPREQARRIKLFCKAYGVQANAHVIDAILDAVASNIERLNLDGRLADVEWWQGQLNWLAEHRAELNLH